MSREIESVDNLLIKLIKKRKWEGNFSLRKLQNEWADIVHKNISNHSNPTFIKNKKLYIDVDSPIWSNELTFLKDKVIERINGYYKKQVVNDIFFRIKIENQ